MANTQQAIEDVTDETYLSAEPPGSQTPSRFPGSQGDPCWPDCSGASAREGSQTPFSLNIGAFSLPLETLKNRQDFLALRNAPAVGNRAFLLVRGMAPSRHALQPPAADQPRMGYTVTKKLGDAVTRNRLKRRLRAAVHEVFCQNPAHSGLIDPHDYLLIARDELGALDFSVLVDQLSSALTDLRMGRHKAPGNRPGGSGKRRPPGRSPTQ